MITNWIANMVETAVIRGFSQAFAKMGLQGKPQQDEAFAELQAITGNPLAIESNAATPEATPAIETKRRGK